MLVHFISDSLFASRRCRISAQSRRQGPGWGLVMKFRDLLNNDQLILVACQDCGSKTPVDPALPALEHGVDADIDRLRPELHCPVCGSSDVELRAHSPVVHGVVAATRAAERA